MNNINNDSLPELKIIAEALKSLKNKNIIRTKNLVGDLGEYYCKEYFGLTLEENAVNKGFDAIDKEGKKVEIKIWTRVSELSEFYSSFINTLSI